MVAEKWEKEGKAEGSRLVLEEFALYSGKIGGAMKLTAIGVEHTGDTAGREVVVGCGYGLREGYHGGSAMRTGSPDGGKCEEGAARTRI